MRIVGEDARQTVTAQSMLDTVRTRSDQDTNPQAAKVRGADAEVSNRQTVHVDRAKFVRRVAQAFEAAAERNGTVRMRLRPPELGSLRLELHLRNGVMTARLEAETPTTQRLLVEHLPALRERLIEQNIRVDRFDVDLMGNGFQQGRQETASDRRPWQAPSWNDAGGRVGNPAEGDEAVDTAAVYRRVRSTDFDVLA
ncbi:flagellar hook-length control protein FliK [Thermostilla marina]